jgi:hypothetical protein
MPNVLSKSPSTRDGSFAFVAGSTVEGQPHARHMAGQRDQDIDMMITEGVIDSPDTLISTLVLEFVQVKFAGVQVVSSISLKSKENQRRIPCVNGLQMKEL